MQRKDFSRNTSLRVNDSPLDVVATAIDVREANVPESLGEVNALAVAPAALVADGGLVLLPVVRDGDLLAAPWVAVGLLAHHTVREGDLVVAVLNGPTASTVPASRVIVGDITRVRLAAIGGGRWRRAGWGRGSD